MKQSFDNVQEGIARICAKGDRRLIGEMEARFEVVEQYLSRAKEMAPAGRMPSAAQMAGLNSAVTSLTSKTLSPVFDQTSMAQAGGAAAVFAAVDQVIRNIPDPEIAQPGMVLGYAVAATLVIGGAYLIVFDEKPTLGAAAVGAGIGVAVGIAVAGVVSAPAVGLAVAGAAIGSAIGAAISYFGWF
ncbi:hypothetical protein [Piscinibacter sakaiensis]|uniref:hypothetical protein n=1 Tax=Piscinibacter sakaiensis TaxID=1547922 RepID=UPI003AAF72D7